MVQYIKDYKLTERRGFKKENICFDIIVAFENGDIKAEEPSNLEEFVNKSNEGNATWEALDLIKHLLKLDYVLSPPLRRNGSLPGRPSTIPSSLMPDLITLHPLILYSALYTIQPLTLFIPPPLFLLPA